MPDEESSEAARLSVEDATRVMRRWAPYGPAEADAEYDRDLDALIAAVTSEAEAASAARSEALLRRIEWGFEGRPAGACCPDCGAQEQKGRPLDGHFQHCGLRAALTPPPAESEARDADAR